MSTGVVSLAVAIAVSVVVHVLLLTSAFVGPTDGAVRGADRHSYASAVKSTIDRQGFAPPAYNAAGHRRGAKNYACLQDLTQAAVPPGPELAPVRSGDETVVLMEDRTVVLGEDEADADIDDDIDTGSGTNVSTAGSRFNHRRYSFRLLEMSPLSITVTSTCSSKDDAAIAPRWWVQYEGRYIAALANGSQFFRSCVQRGVYQVIVDQAASPVLDDCSYRLGYNRKGAEEFRSWPFRNLSAPSRIKVQQQRRRYVVMIKWEKSKLDIHVMNYCLAISTGRRQRTLCQALGNSIHRPSCDTITVNDFLHRLGPRDERKLDSDVETTIVCTGTRTKQLIRGMKPNITYYVDVFAIHSQHNNLSFLLGSAQVQLNRTRPTQLFEGKVAVGKLSTLGGVSLFNFKVPKRSSNKFFNIHLTPCGGTVSLEVLKKKRRIIEVRDVYYPRTITVSNVFPGERYLIRVNDADDSSRLNRIQVVVSSRNDFLDLPRMPNNTTILELTSLRKCHSSTIAWFGSPDKDVSYCVYVFKLLKTQYYTNNVKIPTYCELENRDVCNHPQFHHKHCLSYTKAYNLLSLDIPNLLPEHYYTVYVTANTTPSRSLPYKSVRIKTAPNCLESNQIHPTAHLGNGKGAMKSAGFRKLGGQKRRNTGTATKNSLSERGTLKRSRKQQDPSSRNV